MNSSRKITLWGAMPPVLGGVSVHVERLADTLFREGWDVRVFDLYSPPDWVSEKPYPVFRGRGLRAMRELMADLIFRHPSVVHVHLSSGRNLPVMAPLLTFVRMLSRLVITFHSGSTAKDMGAFSGLKLQLAKLGLFSASRIICVNTEILTYLSGKFPKLHGRLRHIIPFIVHPKAIRIARTEPRPMVVLAAGSITPIYDWLTFIDACQQIDGLGEIQMAFYGASEESYRTQVETACSAYTGPKRLHRNLTPDAFAKLLGSVDVFVRPTLTDGDSMAVREALALGIPVIASNSVPRPSGCLLFPTGDIDTLRELLQKCVNTGPLPPVCMASCASISLLELYQEVSSHTPRI